MTSIDKLKGRKTLRVGAILEDFEKDRVKERVDLVELFEFFGVKLTKQGSGFSGLCPFHDDHRASLSVDGEAGLYHCFGCGASGDAFTLVEKLKGCDFKDALSFLRSWTGRAVMGAAGASFAGADRGSTRPAALVEAVEREAPDEDREGAESAEAAGEASGSGEVGDDGRLLDTVSERYERALAESAEARAYLEGRGLFVPESLKRFRVGYADGRLAELVGDAERAALMRRGVLTEAGRERLERCIVVPLIDDAGRVAGFYGRAIDGGAKLQHRYLPGPHRGLVNREAARAYRDRVLLTEAVLDALSLDILGIHNAIPCYGAHGFTSLHEQLLKEERVREAVVAFDADEAGEVGTAAVAGKLAGLGITVFVARPNVGKDWNEFLQAGKTREDFEALVSALPGQAAAVQAADDRAAPVEPDALVMTKEAGRYRFEREGVRYRMQGVRDQFTASLRVSLRLEGSEAPQRSYVDTVDLYSARSRGAYAAAGSLACGGAVEAGRIERDLLAMLDLLEAERDARLASGREDGGSHELTEEERAAGMALLTDPALDERIIADLSAAGYVGEEVNKLLVYLAATSRKLQDPLSVIVSSQSASGKSYLIDTVKALMPPEDVVSMTSLSDQALNYLGEDALMHKFLIMGEAVHAESVEHQIREMLSGKELSRLVVVKDERTGELRSRMVRKRVVVALAMSTTKGELNPENASRCFIVSTDESEAQTRAVHEAQRGKYAGGRRAVREAERAAVLLRHRAAQRLLTPVAIVNPYVELLDFPTRMMRTRRDHERFLDLIAAVCFLRQFQKERRADEDGQTYVACDMADYRIAYRVLAAILPSTLSSIPRLVQDIYEELRTLAGRKAEREGILATDVELSQREIREATGLAHHQVKRALRVLADYEYVQERGSMARGSRHGYRLVRDEPLCLVDLSVVPTPEELSARAHAAGIEL